MRKTQQSRSGTHVLITRPLRTDIIVNYRIVLQQSLERISVNTQLEVHTIMWFSAQGLSQHAPQHYTDVIMSAMAYQITSLTIVFSVYSVADQRKHQSSAPQAFVWGIHRWPVTSPHKWLVRRKMFPFDDVIMNWNECNQNQYHLFRLGYVP